MGNRFKKIATVLKDAHQPLVHDQWWSSTGFGDPLTPTELGLLKDVGSILQDNEDAPILLGKTSGQSLQEVNWLTEGTPDELIKLINQKCETARFATILLDDILQRRWKLFILFPIVEGLQQVDIYFIPQYNNGVH